MKINFDAVMFDLNDEPIKDGKGDLTLKTIAIGALTGVFADEQHLGGDEKFKRFALSLKINSGGEVDLMPEEISNIKLLIGKAYAPLFVGRAYEILNG